MYLSNQEERIVEGENGEGYASAMKLLVALGEMFDADKLIPITRAHWAVSGQEGDLFYAEKLANFGARTSVPTTTNPAWDGSLSDEFKVEVSDYELSLLRRTISASDKLGVIKSFSCTPYLYKDVPAAGEHTAFSESSATPYINSIYGAMTNRESSSSALAAGVIGKTPNYGLHLDRNRSPNIVVSVEFKIKDDFDFGLLGWYLGEILKPDDIPLIRGVEGNFSPEALRDFGAMINTSGAVSLFHIENFTPEAKKVKDFRRWLRGSERVSVSEEYIASLKKKFTKASGKINSVYMGCPHSTVPEIMKVNSLLGDRKVHRDVRFLIFTSATNLKLIGEANAKKLKEKGVHLLRDSCVDEPVFKFTEGNLGVTNSLKAAYYRKRRNQDFVITSIENCVEAAVRGEI
jgi:predicted aconitase